MNNDQIRQELDPVIADLESKGITINSSPDNTTGLGDMVEATLQKFGITQERFKQFFNLQECNCSKRRKFLNSLLSWKKTGV